MEPNWKKAIIQIRMVLGAVVFAVLLVLAFNLPASSCTIAVVSAEVSADGHPMLWKNYDMSQYWHQQVKYFTGDNNTVGGYYLLYHDNDSIWANKFTVTPQAGVNEAGLSVAVAAVADSNLLNTSANANTRLLQDATANCVSIDDFENYLQIWHQSNISYAVSANYAVIDALGGAAMYEVYMSNKWTSGDTLKYKKYDANTGQVSDHLGNIIKSSQDSFAGYYVRSNLNSYFPDNAGSERAA
ncbi:MAG: hypothetical protein PHU36_06905, partial [Syntrophomonadaceae bacterium]|nr:hypothetical protein [Syntrophomonadaceae bacterium]